jgi:hypothetical protein
MPLQGNQLYKMNDGKKLRLNRNYRRSAVKIW